MSWFERFKQIRAQCSAEIQSKRECPHTNAALSKYTKSNGSIEVREQCVRCGLATKVVKKSEIPNLNALLEWDDTIRGRFLALLKLTSDSGSNTWAELYAEYLQSPEWKSKRERVLRRDDHLCQGCLDRPATEVHHTHYETVGGEMLYDLVSLCSQCHAGHHPEKVGR